MFDLLSHIPGKKKRAGNGWITFNAVCCHHRGHRADTRRRGGVMVDGEEQTYHCFNCGFKCRFVLGKTLSKNTKLLLKWLGIDEYEIAKINLKSKQHQDIIDYVKVKEKRVKAKFKEATLPKGILLSDTNPYHARYVKYLANRGFKPDDYPFLVTPHEKNRNKDRIVIPYTYQNKIVGHISRYLDDKFPKYVKNQPTGYVFGYDLQKPEYSVCLVTEGVFDALAINGCALGHDDISQDQATLLKSMKKKIIVIPDFDKTGLTLCDKALSLGFHVALPEWEPGIKDANDAVLKYGKIPTILSILQAATTSKTKIQILKTKIAKQYDNN